MVIINDINDEQILDEILEQDLIVYEDVKGTIIYAKWDGEDFVIKPDLKSNPINFIDESIETFYGKAYSYLNNLSDRVKMLLNKKWWFCFQYFPTKNDDYNRKAKHDLILCGIIKSGKNSFTVEELEEYARLLDVEPLPFIFKGKLTDKMVEAIKYFLNTSEDDLEYVFGEKSFAYFFYKLLNPQLSHSFLMDNEFNTNVEKIILKSNDKEASFAILNPLYKKISDRNLTEYAEVYSLIIVNFLNFCQSVDLDKMKLKGEKRDDVYTLLISKLFNTYLIDVKDDISKFNFVIPEFFNKDKFRINKELILNKTTRELINEDPKFEYIFKCIFFSFKYKMKEPIGILNNNMLDIFNNYIDRLGRKIDEYLNKKSEYELNKKGLVDFGDFFDIKYDTDAEDKVYPDIIDDIRSGGEEKKKKKGVFSKGEFISKK
jgi:hypothetical protein